jgi:hypothetical protein
MCGARQTPLCRGAVRKSCGRSVNFIRFQTKGGFVGRNCRSRCRRDSGRRNCFSDPALRRRHSDAGRLGNGGPRHKGAHRRSDLHRSHRATTGSAASFSQADLHRDVVCKILGQPIRNDVVRSYLLSHGVWHLSIAGAIGSLPDSEGYRIFARCLSGFLARATRDLAAGFRIPVIPARVLYCMGNPGSDE